MTWQGDEARVSDMAQGQPSRRAEFQPSVTSQAKPTLHATSICHVIIIHDMYTPTSNPPVGFFFFFPSFLPLPITQFHFPTMQILKTGTIIYQKTSQKFPFTNLWIFDKQSLKNVPKIKNQ